MLAVPPPNGWIVRVSLIIPTLNEVEGMRAVMPLIDPAWYDQMIIVDGGSTDGTLDVAESLGCLVIRQKSPGMRHAYRECLEHVTGDVMLTFSPDGNSLPELIPRLTAKMAEGCDMVIASRYLEGAGSDDDDVVTAFGNWLFTRTINLLHGGHYTDAMVIFRAYRTQLVRDLELDSDASYSTPERLFRTRISWEPLLSVRAAKRKLKVAEIPGREPPRIGGERKLQILRWGAAYYYQILRERLA